MASSSTSVPASSPFSSGVTEKLGKNNFIVWQAQVLPAIRGARLEFILDSSRKVPDQEIIVKSGETTVKQENPDYNVWVSQDQQVLGFLISSLSREVLPHAVAAKTAAALWDTLQEMYAAKSRAHTTNTRIALANAEKGTKSMAEYVAMMKTLENEMISAGKTLEDEDMVSYILAGLDLHYDALVAAILARVEPITVSELYSQLLSYESRQQMLRGGSSQSSANAAMRGGRGRFGGRGGRGGQGRGNNPGAHGHYNNNGRGRGNYNNNGRGRGNYNSGNYNNNGENRGENRPRCQLCNVTGHVVKDCWYRYDEDFVPRERSAAAANYNNNNNYGANSNWYIDTGATDHITGELEKLHVHDKYHGNDQVHTASGAGSGHEENSA